MSFWVAVHLSMPGLRVIRPARSSSHRPCASFAGSEYSETFAFCGRSWTFLYLSDQMPKPPTEDRGGGRDFLEVGGVGLEHLGQPQLVLVDGTRDLTVADCAVERGRVGEPP